LREVPTVALYKVAPAQEELARRVWLRAHPFVTLPNILLGREVVPECLQEFATPERLANALEAILTDARALIEGMREVRAALGNADALRRCAAFAVALASGA
jgi:lipid-A-disaccharide synthase